MATGDVYVLTEDKMSAFRNNGKPNIKGLKGDKVTEISRSDKVVIVEGDTGRFSVNVEILSIYHEQV